MAGSSEVQFATLYPAPFGDFENITTNSLAIIGTVRGDLNSDISPIDATVHQVTDLNRIRHYRGLRVLGEFVAPYSIVDRTTVPLADFSDYDWDRVVFNRLGKGIFFNGPQNGLFFFERTVQSLSDEGETLSTTDSNIGLRAKNNIILHPGMPDTASFETYRINFNKKNAVLCHGELIVNGGFSVKNSEGKVLLTIDQGQVMVDGDLSVKGNLLVHDKLLVQGQFWAKESLFHNLRVTNALVVQNETEEKAEKKLTGSSSWEDAQSTNYAQTNVLVEGAMRIKKLLILQSDKEEKAKWTWKEVPPEDKSQLQVFGNMITKSITSPFADRFEVRANNNQVLARFHVGRRGVGHPALEVPGEVHGRRNTGKYYV